MMKFFRKHNKKLLAVFMCGLLIVWLGGSALESMMAPNQAGVVWATCSSGEITHGQFKLAELETSLLGSLGYRWNMPFNRMQRKPLDVPSFILLRDEARRMGVRTSREQVVRKLAQRDKQAGEAGIPTSGQIAAGRRQDIEVVRAAVASHLDVVQYCNSMSRAASVNAAEVLRAADDARTKVFVRAAALRAEMFVDSEQTFSESEMREQFDKFKDQKRSGKGMNFGYVLPSRVKVQYAKIDPQAVRDELDIDSELLEKEANRYWRGHKQDAIFVRPPAEEPAEDATTQPSDESAETEDQESSNFTKWVEARDAAYEEIRRQRSVKASEELADWLLDQISAPWDPISAGTNGFKATPKGVETLDLFSKALASAPGSLLGTDAVQVTITGWVSSENAQDIPELGEAVLPNPSGRPVRFGDIVLRVQGLTELPTGEDAAGIDRASFLAVFQPCPYVLSDQAGNLYVFRPVEIDAERPARDIDEVRDEVVEDLRFARGYELAKAAAESLRASAATTNGLEAAWNADEALKGKAEAYAKSSKDVFRLGGLLKPVPVARRAFGGEPTERVPQLGRVNDAFVKACFAMRDADTLETRLRHVDVPEAGTAVVVEWVREDPLNEAMMKDAEAQIGRMMEFQRFQDFVSPWIDPKQIKARNNFKFKLGR